MSSSQHTSAFKILTRTAWDDRGDELPQTALDLVDGFHHLSFAEQVRPTLQAHFAGVVDLVIAEVHLPNVDGIRVEPSREGALFPHVYGPIPIHAVSRVFHLDEGLESLGQSGFTTAS